MAKCTYCDDKKYMVDIKAFSFGQGKRIPCPECNKEGTEDANTFGINIHKSEPNFDIYALPVDKDELKLIKIGLFEVSEYLDSPKLRELRQRVNAISNSIKPKLPADSIFNKGPFAQAAAEFREAAAYMKSTALSKEPK